jgi:FkbM family methyltransferase
MIMGESLGTYLAQCIAEKGSIAVDVGAGIYPEGADYVSILLNSVGLEGKVYAFDAFNIDTIPDAPNLVKIGKSVWSSSGRFKPDVLFPWGIPTAISSPKAPSPKDEYETVSLDDYFPTEKIDFVKMDIEGAEAHALLGMKNLIDRNPDFAMILELHWDYLSMFNSSKEEIWKFLKERGFYIYGLGFDKPFYLVIEEEQFRPLEIIKTEKGPVHKTGLGSHLLLTKETFNVQEKSFTVPLEEKSFMVSHIYKTSIGD